MSGRKQYDKSYYAKNSDIKKKIARKNYEQKKEMASKLQKLQLEEDKIKEYEDIEACMKESIKDAIETCKKAKSSEEGKKRMVLAMLLEDTRVNADILPFVKLNRETKRVKLQLERGKIEESLKERGDITYYDGKSDAELSRKRKLNNIIWTTAAAMRENKLIPDAAELAEIFGLISEVKKKDDVNNIMDRCQFNSDVIDFKQKFDVQTAEDYLFETYCEELNEAGFSLDEDNQESQW